ncbi:MAG: hypothetical protein KDA20_01510 [Phycisphaerales bacterium]|nr:hypothetical protein [Phycisphaerales bacterium]
MLDLVTPILARLAPLAAASSQPVAPANSPSQMIPAWAMLGILAVIVTALLGLVLLTLVRVALKRSVMRAEPEVYVDPPTGAWQVAGQRVKPITAGATPKSDDDDETEEPDEQPD